ncbi:aspartyl-tRNA(Asn)/glutamyl-tRNA(Gln) amidotransferase subunit A [Rhizobium sp. SG_E_25_P2]|uniref:amidase n=1 Tax=Rhizobium sp. SG_E_25_P2 TaxID=2879942 RepID=UPI0024737F06|nr:amidase [Rhizobium sp. SG_E_25_P2]MDH6265930.1 aspartyl-tRNA(Asn)/glutamyl-tRNA(Gln) amidotransferase subunit A [Rhizobium sp. SG_E_25_P2]
MSNEQRGRSIAGIAASIQTGALDPRDLIDETLDAIDRYPDQAIFICLTPERARAEAQASSCRIRDGRSLGLLDGVPFGWKDLFDVTGVTTTAGSVVLSGQPPASADADVVKALSAAGMVSVGKTNMSEFAFSGLGLNPHFGTPRNPASGNDDRITGGSSSGSAAAVAAGLVPAAMGTDTGGSIRIPAAFNGIVGYKATRGRYSMKGVFPLAASLDALGPLCRTVQDAVWIDAAMRNLTAPLISRRSLVGQRFVIADTVFFDGAETGVVEAFEAAVERLARAGAVIRRQAFPVISDIFALMAERGPLVTAEAFALHKERLSGPDAARMDPRVVARARLGERISLPDYLHIVERRQAMQTEFAALLAPGELVLTPTLPHVAPLIEPLRQDDDLFFATNGKTLRNTLIGNFLDWCGVSLPCGFGDAGMPVGLMLSGLANSDDDLLATALSAEAVVRGER